MRTTGGIPFVAGIGPQGSENGPPAAATAARQGALGGRLAEFAELAPLVARAEATDVFVHEGQAWIDAGHGAEPSGLRLEPERARALAVRLIALGGRQLDEAHQCVDVALHDGIRVHAVLPPIAPSVTVSIRLPRVESLDLGALEARDAFTRVARERIERLVVERTNVLVSGAGGSGKTTLLGAMLAAAPRSDRIVVLEDVAELRIDHPHVVRLQARPPNAEGAGAVPLEQLVRESLRMRPDRLVLGECRGAEVRELLGALNTGHDGGAGTLHANSIDDVPARLEALGMLAGLSPQVLARQAVSAIGCLVHVVRDAEGRRVEALGRLELDGDRLRVRRE